MNAADRFAQKLASIVSPAPAAPAAAAIESGEKKIASMTVNEIIDSPEFQAGFNERLVERMPEIDAATQALLE